MKQSFPPHVLRAEYHENPLGLGCARPRLSWKLPSGDGIDQVAWQVRAASTECRLEAEPDLFDTERQEGTESVFVAWPGEVLTSRQRVYWQVRVWLRGQKQPTAWGKVAWFEVALLKRSDWKAKWISYGQDGKHDTPPSPFMRRGFTLPGAPVRARLHASALGLFEFHLNGNAVHPHVVLAPGWTDFRHRVQTMVFDVTSLVHEGANTLGAILGEGWYAGYLSCDGKRQIYGGSPALLAQLEIECADGSTVRIVSDKTWEGRTGPIRSADLYNGEHYDAQLELPGWAEPAQVDNTRNLWQPVYERKWPAGLKPDPRVAEPVGPIQEITPRQVTEPAAGVYLFDLGQNISGWARLRWIGRKGQVITLRFGEMLNADGSLYTANLRTAKATDSYTFGEEGLADWQPRFTFHGFRYVEVSGLGRAPDEETITGIVVHNAMRPTGVFHCSDQRVNQLESNIRWGLRSNFLEIPADCPQRDERLGWAGDIQIFSKTAAFFYDTDAFLTKWMRDLSDGQLADGAFPDIAPTFICGFGNAAWADAGVIVPWMMYRRFGDIEILRENYGAMSAWIGYQEKTSRRGVRPPTVYGDWLALDAVIPQHAPVPTDLVGTAYFARTCGIMTQVAALLGNWVDAQRFKKLHRQVIVAFQKEFVSVNGRVVGDCQTAYLLALAFGLLPEVQRPKAVERLVALIETRGWHLSTGFVGTPLLCPVLSRFGRHDVAMKLLLQDTYPSWLFTVKNGATTMWERWNSYTPDKGFGDVSMNSFNHYAYGAIGEWLVHYVAGMTPGAEAPAYRHIVFRPQPAEGLTSAAAELETPYGRAAINWEVLRGKLKGEVIVPPNTFADFTLGAPGVKYAITLDGRKVKVREGVSGLPSRLSSGHYVFRAL
ncbi:MAG: family 78 glycoside hydrolase catalytic domain [Opitutaceae bacterium]|jgi:alpha-L-rhamnosidase